MSVYLEGSPRSLPPSRSRARTAPPTTRRSLSVSVRWTGRPKYCSPGNRNGDGNGDDRMVNLTQGHGQDLRFSPCVYCKPQGYTRVEMPEIDDPMVVIALTVGATLLVIVVVLLLRRGGRRRLETLAPAFELGTTRVSGPFGYSIEGLYRGYPCRYSIEQRSQYSPGGATLRVHAISHQQWSAGIKDVGSQLMVRVGILKDYQIGDSELDEQLRFSSTDQAVVMTVFAAEATRGAIRTLSRSENFSSVTVRPDRADIKWNPRNQDLDENPDVVRSRLAAATALLAACGYPPQIGAGVS